jgi:hypothetical protein
MTTVEEGSPVAYTTLPLPAHSHEDELELPALERRAG